jgi:multiple sugar transport system permease protein
VSLAAPAATLAARPRLSRRGRESFAGLLFSVPAVLLLIATILAPLGVLLVLSFTDYELGAVDIRWLGLDNYAQAFRDPVFRRSIANTLIYVAIVLPGGIVLGLFSAIAIHGRTRLRGFYETAFFLPVTATLIAMAAVWQFLLHPRIGPVNEALKLMGFREVAFLSEPSLLMPTLAFIGLWNIIGFNMVLFLAGLAAIPKELYDAAEVDGAGGAVDRFLTVTWPMLAPTTLFVAVTTSITAFKVFDTVAILTGGKNGTEVLLYAIYLEGFQYFKMGYAAALTLIFLMFLLVFSIVQAVRLDRRVHY